MQLFLTIDGHWTQQKIFKNIDSHSSPSLSGELYQNLKFFLHVIIAHLHLVQLEVEEMVLTIKYKKMQQILLVYGIMHLQMEECLALCGQVTLQRK